MGQKLQAHQIACCPLENEKTSLRGSVWRIWRWIHSCLALLRDPITLHITADLPWCGASPTGSSGSAPSLQTAAPTPLACWQSSPQRAVITPWQLCCRPVMLQCPIPPCLPLLPKGKKGNRKLPEVIAQQMENRASEDPRLLQTSQPNILLSQP